MKKRPHEQRAEIRSMDANEPEIRRLLEAAGPRPEVPSGDLAIIKATALAEWERLVGSRSRPWRALAPLAVAASLVFALVLGWWWLRSETPSISGTVATVELVEGLVRRAGPVGSGSLPALAVGETLATGTELTTTTTPQGSPTRLSLRLAGGQSVRLDAGSSLRLLGESSLELKHGAVYVDSGPTARTDSAVEIATAFGTVREIGTQFEVRLAEGEAALRVRVREGAVSVREGTDSLSAAAGEELTLRGSGAVDRGRVEPYGSAWAWAAAAAPGLEIEGVSLQTYLEWVSRETGRRIRFENEQLAESAAAIEIHGTIEGLSPEESLDAVLPGSGLDHRSEDGTLLIFEPA